MLLCECVTVKSEHHGMHVQYRARLVLFGCISIHVSRAPHLQLKFSNQNSILVFIFPISIAVLCSLSQSTHQYCVHIPNQFISPSCVHISNQRISPGFTFTINTGVLCRHSQSIQESCVHIASQHGSPVFTFPINTCRSPVFTYPINTAVLC